MRILICTPEYPPYSSGIGNVVYNIVKKLKNRNIDCKICSPVGPDFKVGNPFLMSRIGVLGLIYYWYLVSRKIKENDFDLVWIHGNVFLPKISFKNALITLHSTYLGFKLLQVPPKFYYKICSRLDNHFLKKINTETNCKFTGVSPEVCTELRKVGINKKKIVYISNGVDTECFKPLKTGINKELLRKKFGIPIDDLVLLSVGRLVEPKRPVELIRIFSIIERTSENVTLVIAGEGELLNKMKRVVKDNNLRKVKFLGNVSYKTEIPDLFACSDYFIMTSKYEGQPLTLLEAMASGLRCIVSKIPNLTSIVEKADCGISIDVENEQNAANDILTYLGSSNDHSRNARKFTVQNCDWENVVDHYIKEIENIIN